MENTFEKEITFKAKVLNPETNKWSAENITKKATFKELDDTDRSQHNLHFQLLSMFQSYDVSPSDMAGGGAKMRIDPKGMYDIVVIAVETLLVVNTHFTERDKANFLNSSAALMQFALWLLPNKLLPFFGELQQNLS